MIIKVYAIEENNKINYDFEWINEKHPQRPSDVMIRFLQKNGIHSLPEQILTVEGCNKLVSGKSKLIFCYIQYIL